ncbi:MAG: HD domain-containing phosphohydrolase [Acidobacteriota bacterium]
MLTLDPEAEKRAKELLYRCLEELGATKAALYLAGDAASFELVTHYGFGRRDAVVVSIKPGDALWDWIRRHRTGPAFLNDVHDDRALAQVLDAASSARLMTIPLTLGDRLVGLVDLRDKGRRAQFEAADIPVARSVATALVEFVRGLGIYGPVPAPAEAPPAPAPAPPPRPPAEARPPLLHTSAIEPVAALLRTVAAFPGVAATALAVSDGRTVRVAVHRTMPLDNQQREALATHQFARFEEAGARVPPPARWGWTEEDSGGSERHADEIRTALLLGGPPLWVVASFVTAARSGLAEPLLAITHRHFEQARALSAYRRAARGLARILLEPGETSFPHLRQHSQAVSELAQRMAAALALGEEQEELVTVAAYLHDLGMRELDYARIYRMERPGEAERRTYQRHPIVGARIVEASEFPGGLARAILHHHERWDGAGYPQRLAAHAIPLASRIIHLAEVFDVLTSPASYRRGVGRDGALQAIRAEAGRQFDPELVPVLVKVVGA